MSDFKMKKEIQLSPVRASIDIAPAKMENAQAFFAAKLGPERIETISPTRMRLLDRFVNSMISSMPARW